MKFLNKWLGLGAALYAVSLAILVSGGNFGAEDAIFGLIVLGLIFPCIAWISTRNTLPLEINVEPTSHAMVVLAVYIAFVTVYLVWGTG